MRKVWAAVVAAGVVAGGGGVTPLPAQAADTARDTVRAQQGDRIRIGDATYCTLGYVDAERRIGFTAAHCGSGGDRVAVLNDGTYLTSGTFYPSNAYGRSVSGNDWALIRFDDGVDIGPNRFSGNARVAPEDVRAGDRLCVYGSATKLPSCGTFAGTLGGNVYWDQSPATVGDSGGAVYLDGRGGFVGVLSGHSIVTSPEGEHTVLRAAAPEDRPAPTQDDEISLISDFYRDHAATGLIVHTPVVGVTDAASRVASRVERRIMEQSSGSSDWEAGTLPVIAALVAGVLVASAPSLVQLISTVRGWRG